MKLKVYNGDITITTPNTVVDGLEVHGIIKVEAPGAIIKNSLVLGRADVTSAFVSNYPNGNSFTIQDSEVRAIAPSVYANGIMGSNFTALRVNVHDVVDPIRITGGNVKVTDSYLHDNLHYLVDPTHDNGPSHDDSIQIQGGTGITIEGNTFTNAHNAAIQITQSLGQVGNLKVEDNYLDGGDCTVNISESPKGAMSGISFARNTFGLTRTISYCAILTPTTTKVGMNNNIWQATGEQVKVVTK